MTNFTTKKHTNFKMDGFKNFILEKLQENDQTIKKNTLCGNVSVDDVADILEGLGFKIVKRHIPRIFKIIQYEWCCCSSYRNTDDSVK